MAKIKRFNRVAAAIFCVFAVLLSVYSPAVASALASEGTGAEPTLNELNYTDKSSYGKGGAIDLITKKNYGIYECLTSELNFDVGVGIRASYDYLAGKTDIEKPFVIYNTVSGTRFETEITYNKSGVAAVEQALGKEFLPVLYISKDAEEWIVADSSAVKTDSSSLNSSRAGLVLTIESVPENYNFVKIEYPMNGDVSLISSNAFRWAGNDLMEIARVSFTKGLLTSDEDDFYGNYTFGNLLNYSDNSVYNYSYLLDVVTKKNYDVYSVLPEAVHFGIGSGLRPSYDYLAGKTELEKPYVVYNTVPKTAFQTEITFNNSEVSKIEAAMGKSFLPELYISKDFENWEKAETKTLRLPTGQLNSNRGSLILTIEEVPEGYNFVKIEYPMNGDVSIISNNAFRWAGNDLMEIATVSFTKGTLVAEEDNIYGNYTFADVFAYSDSAAFDKKSLIDIVTKRYYGIYRTVDNCLYAYPGSGISPSWDYLADKTDIEKPYASYNVVPGTAFQTEITFNGSSVSKIEKALGTDFMPTLYISKDHETWEKAEVKTLRLPISLVNSSKGTVILTIEKIPDEYCFVKVELPHTGDMSIVTNKAFQWAGNDVMEIASVSCTRGTLTAPEDNIYGDYTFANVINYSDKTVFDTGYLLDVITKGYYDVYRSTEDGLYETVDTGIAASWNYLYGKTDLEKLYVSYNVIPGTAFQTEVTFNGSAVSKVENALGSEFMPKLYISKDHEVWEEADANSLRLPVSLLKDSKSSIILTISQVPEGYNFVKVELPFTADVSIATNNAFQWAGNDIMEIASVSFTKGTLTAPEDNIYGDCSFESKLDFTDTKTYLNSMAINSNTRSNYRIYGYIKDSLHFDKGTGIAPSWNYLNEKENIENPYVSYNVVPGTAFQTEVTFVNSAINVIESALGAEFMPELYISKDNETWEKAEFSSRRFKIGPKIASKGSIILTVESVPEGYNFVKIQFPHTGDMSVATDKAFQWAGNDIMEISGVYFTQGDMVPPDYYDTDMGSDENDSGYYFDSINSSFFTAIYNPGGNSDRYFSSDDSLYYNSDSDDNSENGRELFKNKRKVTKRIVTVIDGYYYPWWVWTLWIGGGVLATAAIAFVTVIVVRKRKKAVSVSAPGCENS